ncbi:hypothetical protein AAES_32582 [Amazona aestiva]|uniref:Uncharacterized protein n=1 Tax=Amazona aestiva TaxID=12930 RepID=A0A0Q3V8Q8_AMAAE|nr:hypothetical protein AAES_32582 [Amazona aestiva]
MCWGLANVYQALFNTIQHPQEEEKVSGSDDKTTGTAAILTLVTDMAAEQQNQLVPAFTIKLDVFHQLWTPPNNCKRVFIRKKSIFAALRGRSGFLVPHAIA